MAFLKGLASFVLATVLTVAGYYMGIFLAIIGGVLTTLLTILGIIGVVAVGIYSYWLEKDEHKRDPPTKQ